jgi:ABC-type bacteriocin/lantibiotic exporter with double-glycine peptidase domain
MRVQQPSAAPCSGLALIEAVDLEKRYKDQTVFSDLSFELSAGSAAALIGPSGCGKTTLAEILATISAPDSGDVFVTLHSGARLKLSDLQIRIGFVSQNPTILDGTIFENITLMGPETQLSVDQRGKLDQALTLSGFGAILAELADGLKTIVGEEARKLSGGQKQKLSICRALFLSDGLLIFDEPTSAFDKKSETEFFENLSAIKQDHVVFVVTHSVKFQSYFDKVFEFASNSVVATEKQ